MKHRAQERRELAPSMFERATIVALRTSDETGERLVELRIGARSGPGEMARARLAFLPGYEPAPGDRVLCVEDEGERVVVSVLKSAQRDLHFSAPGGTLHLRAREVRVEADETSFVARAFAVTASAIRHDGERYELVAERVVERAREVLREASELVEMRAGRLRALVSDVFDLRSRRTVLRSDGDTSIDGRKILLG